MVRYGQQLKQLREKACIEAKALAGSLGISRSLLSERETGAKTMTEAEFLRAQAALLDLVEQRDAEFAETRRALRQIGAQS